MPRLAPTQRSDYKLLRKIQTRWADVDVYGHVNNVVYLSYFDTAINGWYLDIGILDMANSDKIFLVVETGAQFFSEIRFPDIVYAGIRVIRLGSSSVTYDIALFINEDETACARGRYTHVLVGKETRKPVAIEGSNRNQLQAIIADNLEEAGK